MLGEELDDPDAPDVAPDEPDGLEEVSLELEPLELGEDGLAEPLELGEDELPDALPDAPPEAEPELDGLFGVVALPLMPDELELEPGRLVASEDEPDEAPELPEEASPPRSQP